MVFVVFFPKNNNFLHSIDVSDGRKTRAQRCNSCSCDNNDRDSGDTNNILSIIIYKNIFCRV